ncbi:hypothetical protein SELMODRAFT_227195 [Selaginella moellendorffii]|uniref:DUF1279 domain-containing protein n=1 Tax=Selaginella moellendorffii TaxID=88036 RepID=D8QN08_SELML|nr:hypothetical protein SELMODRAFT_227195 [Selaginella moellendorffii]
MASASWALRLRELSERYGKVAVGVHFSVSAISTGTIYLAIKNNVDVVALLEKVGLVSKKAPEDTPSGAAGVERVWSESEESSGSPDMAQKIDDPSGADADPSAPPSKEKKRSDGAMGALGLALLCNKALFPVRVPITVMLTPPVHRLLTRIKARL